MRISSLHRLTATLVLSWLAMGIAGCSDGLNAGGLTLTSLHDKQSYHQTFSNAYSSHNDAGDLDIVLVDDATEKALEGEKTSAAVQQIMHVRVLWSAPRDLKANDAAASNATLRWYVIGCQKNQNSDPKSGSGMIEYAGTAWVSTTTIKSFMRVSIDNAQLKPIMKNGLADPVGPSKVEGAVIARDNTQIVNQLLAEIQTHSAVAAASTHAGE